MLLYAHRGSSGPAHPDLLENSLAAVTATLRCGADGVEVDLRLSADGVLVLCHDPTLRRTAGSGLAVATSSWQDLRTACAARGHVLGTAEQVLLAASGRPVVLEVKRPLPGRTPATVAAVVDLLERLRVSGLPLDVTVSSFAPTVVAAVRDAAPPVLGVRTALLGDLTDRPSGLVRQALHAGHAQIHPQVAALLAEPSAVERAHAVGVGVVPWTVNRGRALRRLRALGVDAVITDVPSRARLVLQEQRSAAA